MRALLLAPLLVGCGSHVVPVVPDGASAGTAIARSDASFEVVARSTAIHDPLPVRGASIAYGDLDPALGQAVLRNVRPRKDQTLTVELVAADAEYARTRVVVSLVARATLRTRSGNAFIGQTQVVCRDSALVAPEAGSQVVWSCMARMGRDLGGWLDGLAP